MDRRRRRARALTLAITVAASACLAADAAPPIRAMLWISPQADPAIVLATEPAECLRRPADAQQTHSVEVGRAAFRTPTLLGGQAARARLTCESCHRSGRDNPDFLFPGASGPAGTADVTLSLFSSHRGNGIHDPRPIPDLTGPRGALKVAPADLPRFIRGLIVEEFDGPEPSPAVLDGLSAYVRALNPAACPGHPRSAITLASLMNNVRRALGAARVELAAGDGATAVLMIASARAQLGLIDERYAGLVPERARVRKADAALADLQGAVRNRGAGAAVVLETWLTQAAELEARLAAREARSLFNPTRLSPAANARLPPKAS